MNPKPAAAVEPRDADELEGSLLPPTAVPVDDECKGIAAAAAVPVTTFAYAEIDNAQDDTLTAEVDLPTAPFLPVPEYQSLETREQIERAALAHAQRRGVIQAEMEKEAIQRASGTTYAKQWHAKQQVEVANYEARRRNVEGIQVEDDKYNVKHKDALPNEKPAKSAFPVTYKGGYKVNEYDVTEYKDSDSYDVSEYKSVYD